MARGEASLRSVAGQIGVGDVSVCPVGRSRLAGLMGACLRPEAELRRNEPGSAACDE